MVCRQASVLQFRSNPSLRHSEGGAVSISADGSEVCFALAAAPWLDNDYRVIGRVISGNEALQQASDVGGDADDAPLKVRLVVSTFFIYQ